MACAREARAAPAQHQRTESSFSSGRDSCARGLRLYRAASRAVFSYHHRMNLHGENLSHLRKRERISFRCTALNALYKDAPLGVCSFRSFPVGSYYPTMYMRCTVCGIFVRAHGKVPCPLSNHTSTPNLHREVKVTGTLLSLACRASATRAHRHLEPCPVPITMNAILRRS